MTVPAANGRRPSGTFRDDVRPRMRVVRNGEEASSEGGSASESAYTRAVPDTSDVRQGSTNPKRHNFASPHVVDARDAFGASFALTDRPSSLAEVARAAWPRKGEMPSRSAWCAAVAVGVFRIAVTTAAYLLVLAVDSRTRAAVAFALTVLAVVVCVTAQALPH
jgi:hypothetical protein